MVGWEGRGVGSRLRLFMRGRHGLFKRNDPLRMLLRCRGEQADSSLQVVNSSGYWFQQAGDRRGDHVGDHVRDCCQ